MSDVLTDVRGIIRELLKQDELELAEDTTAADVDGWDSLSNIRIVIAIEKHFGIKFTAKEIQTYQDVGEFCRAIAEKTGSTSD